jgi:hypothetical protein
MDNRSSFYIPVIDYLFYKIYKFALSLKLDDSPYTTLTSITLLEFFNLMIIQNLLHIKIPVNKYLVWLFVLVLLFVNYLIFLRKKRYLKIIDRYEGQEAKQKIIGSICVITYTILTIFFAFYTI